MLLWLLKVSLSGAKAVMTDRVVKVADPLSRLVNLYAYRLFEFLLTHFGAGELFPT